MNTKSVSLIVTLIFGLSPAKAWSQAFAGISKRVPHPLTAPESSNTQQPVSLMKVSGPILGLVFDQSKSGLRPIYGIPGASRLGEVWVLGREIGRAWISSPQDYALVESKSDGSLALVSFGKGSILIRSIKGVAGGVGDISLSAKGGVAALYYPASRGVQFVTGLPDAPQASSVIAFPALSESATAMAVSDDGEAVLVATAGSQNGALHLLTRDSQSRVLTLLGKASAISFLPGTRSALVADEQNDTVLLLQDVTGAATIASLAGASEGIAQPVGVEASEDNRFAFVANAKTRSISAVELQTGRLSHLACSCSPTGLFRMRGNSIFRLNELTDANIQLLDVGIGEPRVLFVPASSNGAGVGPSVPDRGQSHPIQVRPPQR
jgi:hypothetical protein